MAAPRSPNAPTRPPVPPSPSAAHPRGRAAPSRSLAESNGRSRFRIPRAASLRLAVVIGGDLGGGRHHVGLVLQVLIERLGFGAREFAQHLLLKGEIDVAIQVSRG